MSGLNPTTYGYSSAAATSTDNCEEYHADVYPDEVEQQLVVNGDVYPAQVEQQLPSNSEDYVDQVELESHEVMPASPSPEVIELDSRETSEAASSAIGSEAAGSTVDENATQDPTYPYIGFKYSMTRDAIRRRIYRAKQKAKEEGKSLDEVVDPALLSVPQVIDSSNPRVARPATPSAVDPETGRPWSPGSCPYRRNFQYSMKKDAIRKRRKKAEQLKAIAENGGVPPSKKTSRSSSPEIIFEGVFPAKGRRRRPPQDLLTQAIQIFGPSSVLVVQPPPPPPPAPLSPGSMPYRNNFNYSTNKESLKKRRQRLRKKGEKYQDGKLVYSMSKDAIKKRRQRARRLGITTYETDDLPPEAWITTTKNPAHLSTPTLNNTCVPLPPPPPPPVVPPEPRVYRLVNYSMKPDAIRKRRQRLERNGTLLNKDLAIPTETLVMVSNPPPDTVSRESSVIFDGSYASTSADAGIPPPPAPVIATPPPQGLDPTKARVYKAVCYSTHKEAVRKRKQRLRKKALALQEETGVTEAQTPNNDV